MVVAYVLQVLAVTVAPLQALLGTQSLTALQVAQVSAVSALGWVAARLQVVIQSRQRTRLAGRVDSAEGAQSADGAESALPTQVRPG